ncbi:MAG TPA: molecular chaperone TorD family protein [Symbiobacteriaceae bacterium]|nr:molecular chaperone TorD family protein [Symbiobacteriaceae bacterium]
MELAPAPTDERLAGQLLVGRFLALVLQQAPSAEQLAQMLPLLSEFPMEPANPEMARGAALLTEYARETAASAAASHAAAAAVKADFAALFEGPGAMSAPPWESIYRTEEQLLFGPTTFQVRQAYQRWGLGLEQPGREPDDHIALELAFLLFLTERAATDTAAEAERQRFLQNHLLRWVPPFASLVEDGANTRFYQGVAKLLLGYVKACL